MSDQRKTKAQLIAELDSLRRQLATRHGADATAASFKFPLREEEGQRLLAGVSVDITEHRRTEAWLQSLIETTLQQLESDRHTV